ncbi:methionine-synthesizing 5- methyltetrahydropteroyltriglutamate--homocysteine methyltransferase, partial [Chytridiales sp. JEL 0842]
MARGLQRPSTTDGTAAVDLASLPMSKFFDTNYHYVPVPLTPDTRFHLGKNPKPLVEFLEAKNEAGVHTRPAIVGPVSFLLLSRAGKGSPADFDRLNLIENLAGCYVELLLKLAEAGADWVQLDEPHLALDLTPKITEAYKTAYTLIQDALGSHGPKLLISTFFDSLADNLNFATSLPGVTALHVDLVRNPQQIDLVVDAVKRSNVQYLSLGVVNGRNIWKTDLAGALGLVKKAEAVLGKDRLMVGSSCSLLHSPHSLEGEKSKDGSVKDAE